MRYRDRVRHFGGLVTLLAVAFFVLAGPVTVFVAGLLFILFSWVFALVLLAAMVRAMLADMWKRLSRL